ncbi:hypothetical protein GW17_00006009 [Ensete ventricosum]|nr:hypothetical protein GW17_00006009 [Ensete ventricosum]
MSLDVSGHGDPTPITAVLLLGLVADAAEVGFGQNVLAFISASVFQWIWMTWGLGECRILSSSVLLHSFHPEDTLACLFLSAGNLCFQISMVEHRREARGRRRRLVKSPHSFAVVNHDDPLAPNTTTSRCSGGGERDDDKCAVAVRVTGVGVRWTLGRSPVSSQILHGDKTAFSRRIAFLSPATRLFCGLPSFLSAGAMEEERGFLLSVLWYVVTYNGSVSLCTGGQRNREEKAERRPARWTGSEVATEATRSPIEEGGPDVAVPSPPPPPPPLPPPPDRPARRPRTPSGFGAGLAQDLPHDAHVLVLARPHLLPQLLQPCSWEAAEPRATRACQVASSARVDAPVDGGRHWTSFEFCTLSVCVRAQACRHSPGHGQSMER